MRSIIRTWFLYILSLYVLDLLFSFISVSSPTVLFSAATALFLLNTIGRPILKILWLPINIITLGLFSWVLSIIVIVLVVSFVPGFQIEPAHFSSFQIGNFLIPEIHLKMFWTYFFFSFLLAWTVNLLGWLLVGD